MSDGFTIVNLEKRGEAYQVKTKVLIGADGANSRVAKDLKLDENKEWIVGYEEVFHSQKSDEPRLHCFLDAKLAPGYLAWIADDTEEIHIGVGGYAANFNPREALKLFKEKVEFVGNETGVPFETRGGRIPVGGVLRRIANENGLLIGDAAGAVSPLTAGGLDPALRLSKVCGGNRLGTTANRRRESFAAIFGRIISRQIYFAALDAANYQNFDESKVFGNRMQIFARQTRT